MSLPRAPLALLAVLALALGLRLLAVQALPVVFDEVEVMSYGLALGARDPWSLLFRVPTAVSTCVTPLWFWIQALPAAVFGETTRAGLRTVPVLLGLLGTALAYGAGMRLGGPRAAYLSSLLHATCSPLLFLNARGEFTESLLAPLALLAWLDLARTEGVRSAAWDLASDAPSGRTHIADLTPPWRAGLWPAMALLTYHGKGLLLWAGYAAFVLLHAIWNRGRVWRTAALVVGPHLPSLLWMAAAQAVLFRHGVTVETDLGPVGSVWQNALRMTTGYGADAKAFMVGSTWDSLYVYRALEVWPSMPLIVIPAAAALALMLVSLVRAWRNGSDPLPAALPLCLILPPLLAVIGRGALDARLHILYLVVLMPYVALTLARWTEHASLRAQRLVPWALAVVLVGLNLIWGPLRWGREWAWEPGPHEIPRSAASFGNADAQLARRVAGREGPQAAAPFFDRAVSRHSGDRTTLVQAAENALLTPTAPAHTLLPLLADWLRRHPDDAEVRLLLDRLTSRPVP